MKTLNQKIAFFLAAFMLAANFSILASGNENKKDSVQVVSETSFLIEEDEFMSEAELNEIMFSLEDETTTWMDDVVTYYIYDSNDNLVMTAEASRIAPLNNIDLVKTLAQSDLLMTYNNEMHYRLNK